MSTILYAWELGGGYGHTAAFLPIARALKERGHRVMFALRDLQYAETLLGSDDFEYLQAPVRWPHAGAVPPARSYPEILRNSGFAESGELYCQAKAWRTLFRALEPSLIVFDHAPTAVLAARESGIPQVSFGTGFFNPPATSPLPNLRPWQPVSDRELSKTEGQVLANINLALQRLALRTARPRRR